MRPSPALGRVVLVLLCATACSLPVTVKRVDPTTDPTEGVRYVLQRPVFEVFVRVKGDVSAGEFELVLAQSMKPADVYEVGVEGDWFSDTHVSIEVDKNGRLTGFSGGAEDKVSEAVIATVGLYTAAAGFLAQDFPELVGVADRQTQPLPQELADYKARHRQLVDYLKRLERTLTAAEVALTKPIQDPGAVEEIRILRQEIKDTRALIKGHRFRVPDKMVRLTIGGKVVPELAADAQSAWIVIALDDRTESPR